MLHRLRVLIALVTLTALPLVAPAPVAVVNAADQTILGKQLQVKDPKPGVDSTKRKVVGQGRETNSTNLIVGNPTVSGATITFFANGTTSSTQAFSLPAILWSAFGRTGFKYRDSRLIASPVKTAQIYVHDDYYDEHLDQ